MAKGTNLTGFGDALSQILGEYSQEVDKAIQAGGDEAADYFIRTVSAASPVKTGDYKSSWAKKDVKSKYRRYVGNTKKVSGKNGSQIPLINILEYSTVRGRPHVRQAVQQSKSGILDIYKKHLKEA